MQIVELLSCRSLATLALAIFLCLHLFSLFFDRRRISSSMATAAFTKTCDSGATVAEDPEAKSRVFTVADLAVCRGTSSDKEESNRHGFKSSQILLSVNGEVYDVTSHPTGRDFYGEGRAYNVFAACDATMALARVQINKELCNRWDWDILDSTEQKTLADWIVKFRSKYVFVGKLEESQKCRLDLSEYNCPPMCE